MPYILLFKDIKLELILDTYTKGKMVIKPTKVTRLS